jgi:signal transduction histidine kinase/DNA-binding response OmpR family regulator
MPNRQKILIVDDKWENLVALRHVLSEVDAECIEATSGDQALAMTFDHQFALAILDVQMPGMSGYELAGHLRGDTKTRLIPILFLTAHYVDEQDVFKGYDSGGVDYLTKPYSPEILHGKVKVFLELDRYRVELMEHRDYLESLVAERTRELAQKLNERNLALESMRMREEELRNSERRISSLFDISQYPFSNEREFLDHALQEILTLTSSTLGYIYLYSEQNRQFTLNAWSQEVMNECSVLEQQTKYDLDSTGIWGEAVRQRKPILLNDFQAHNPLKKGVPEGHIILRRFLTVPIYVDEAIVAVVGIANKESDYTDADTMQLTLFMDAVWKITAHKRGEAEKEALTIQLQQAQKMESVGQLAGGVAHDFNNMLGVITGYAELALMKMDPSEPVYNNLIEIRTAAERSADLTRQLLAFARKQTIAPKVIDLNATVSGMLKMLKRLIGEDMHITWQQAPDLWLINIDPSQIDQMLANLCVNARDAITDVGRITIETGNIIIDANYRATHAYVEPGEYVRLVVSDDGVGMDKETLTHIFEPFFTTKGVGRGTGLGLATVYGIVKQNNGFINVCSEPGHGTTFSIYLQRHTGKNGEAPKEGTTASAPGGNETLLLVEDEPSILKMAGLILEGYGYTVLTAGTAAEAIRLFKEQSGTIHLLMTDVVMPGMNGRVLLKELRAFNPQLNCLFMSGYTADVIAHHGVLDEGVHFIQKPFSLSDLANKVREVLDGD